MQSKPYYLETEPRSNGMRHMHSAACQLMPEEPSKLVFIGSFSRPHAAMAEARKKHRRASACQYCCKAHAAEVAP